MKDITIYSTKSLGDNVIEMLRTKFDELTWLQYSFPAVKIGISEDNLTYPQVYNQDGTDTHQWICPESDVKSFCFFEKRGYNVLEGIMSEFDLSVIFWVNLKVINLYNYDFTDLLAREVIDMLILKRATDISVSFENPFDKYSGVIQKANQYLMYPYSAFKIDFKIQGKTC